MVLYYLSRRRGWRVLMALTFGLVLLLQSLSSNLTARAALCPGMENIQVPGAQKQQLYCLDDLSTPFLILAGRTDASDWAVLHSKASKNPTGFGGIQIDGYFPDTSTMNGYYGWNHDAQFVIRLPNNWNGKLIVTGAPGVRRQYALDYLISDWVLSRGYAFASTDKGNNGNSFYKDGATPGDAIAEWHRRVTELTVAAKEVVRQRYGRAPSYTYMTGISNGGYLTRFALENHPELYDGGVDWEGTLFRAEGPTLLNYLPVALKHYPTYRATGDQAAHDAMIAAGFSPGSEFIWEHHYAIYWDLTQRVFREELDPAYDGSLEAGIPFCQSGSTPNCDADYDYDSRPQAVRDAVAKIGLTGKIGKPMLTLHGTLDALLPREADSDIYTEMIRKAGRSSMHRYYVIEQGTHVDQLYDEFPDKLRPILPCYRTAIQALENWVESKGFRKPPESGFIAKPAGEDVANTCQL